MNKIAKLAYRSSPHRSAVATWHAISSLLTHSNPEARWELESVSGIASTIISGRVCEHSPIVVSCDGPQTRVYCIYDYDAIDGSGAIEDGLGFNPLYGNWEISFPCNPSDIGWIRSMLRKESARIRVRDKSFSVPNAISNVATNQDINLSKEEFMKP